MITFIDTCGCEPFETCKACAMFMFLCAGVNFSSHLLNTAAAKCCPVKPCNCNHFCFTHDLIRVDYLNDTA